MPMGMKTEIMDGGSEIFGDDEISVSKFRFLPQMSGG